MITLRNVLDFFRLSARPGAGEFTDDADRSVVGDIRFVRQTILLRDLYAFLLFSGVPIQPEDKKRMRIGALKYVRYSVAAPPPSWGQWEAVDNALESLFSLLPHSARRKFLLSQFPSWMPATAVLSLVLVILTLLSVVLIERNEVDAFFAFIAYVIWLASMGALGAMSFISMNVLSVQEDVTFDLTSSRLLAVRIIIGALFGLVLALPFAWDVFWNFGDLIATSTHKVPPLGSHTSLDKDDWNQAVHLLLPFVLGFSTTLVILVLNRVIAGVRAMFGEHQEGAKSPLGNALEHAMPPKSRRDVRRAGSSGQTRYPLPPRVEAMGTQRRGKPPDH